MSNKILVIEDEPSLLDVYKLMAEYTSFGKNNEVGFATNFEEAVQIMQDADVVGIIADNGFPVDGSRVGSESEAGGAGLLFIDKVRNGEFGKEVQNIPIILLSINLTDEKIDKARDLNAHVIEKSPSSVSEAYDYIERELGESKLLQR